VARRIGALCVVLAMAALFAGPLAAGPGLAGQWPWLLVVGGLGLLWLGGYWRGRLWVAPLGLAGFAVAAAAGLLQEVASGWMVFGLVAALCAWDLQYLDHALRDLEPVPAHRALEWSHIQRLLLVAGLSLALAAVALTVEIRLTFVLALLLGLLAAWSLGRLVGFLRHESE
jgi:hypothetical protein